MKEIEEVIDQLTVKTAQLNLLAKHNRDMLFEISNLKILVKHKEDKINSLNYHIGLYSDIKELLENDAGTKELTIKLREVQKEKNKWKKDFQETLSKLIYANQKIQDLEMDIEYLS